MQAMDRCTAITFVLLGVLTCAVLACGEDGSSAAKASLYSGVGSRDGGHGHGEGNEAHKGSYTASKHELGNTHEDTADEHDSKRHELVAKDTVDKDSSSSKGYKHQDTKYSYAEEEEEEEEEYTHNTRQPRELDFELAASSNGFEQLSADDMGDTAVYRWSLLHEDDKVAEAILTGVATTAPEDGSWELNAMLTIEAVDGKLKGSSLIAADSVAWDGDKKQFVEGKDSMVVKGGSGYVAGAYGTIVLKADEGANTRMAFNLSLPPLPYSDEAEPKKTTRNLRS